MSAARGQFLARISSLVRSLNIEAVTNKPLTEKAHNDVARMLRNGLAVVGFAALEDFLKSRTSEVLADVGKTHVPFKELPEKLRFATTFEAISAVSYQLSLRAKADRVAYVQEHAQKIASTATGVYELTPHALGYDQANLPEEAVRTVLKSFLIEDPWGQMTKLASRIGLIALPLEETYRSSGLRRNRAAHVANADTPQTDLVQFSKEALAIAMSFDALLSRALSKMYAVDRNYLTGLNRISAESISIRYLKQDGNRWRETLEGRSSAVKVERDFELLENSARSRAVKANNLLVIYDSSGEISSWECH